MQLLHKELFQVCSLQTYQSAGACRRWQTAYERTTSMINGLTSVTCPNQIFWIYFLVHLQSWGDCKTHMVCQAFQQTAQAHERVTAGESAAVQQLITA